MMDLCKALGEMHVNLEDLPLKQYRARDELPLMQQWARGRADDRVTLPADLETMDLLTTATSQPTLRAVEPWRLRNVFENFFDARRSQLIRSAEIALPILTSWDLLAVDKPADARSRSDKSTEQMLANTTRPVPALLCIFTSGREVHAHEVRQSPAVSMNSAASASMTGPVPCATPRSASVVPRPRIRRFWRLWRG